MPSGIEPQKSRKQEPEITALKKKSLQRHCERAPKEPAANTTVPQPPRGTTIGTKFEDKAKAQRVVRRSSVPPTPLKSSKPWPGSGTTAEGSTDELIKHMSKVPSYLQRATQSRDGDIQGRALNVGVLQWGTLERYTTTKRHSAYGTKRSVGLDPECSSSIMHCRRSISCSGRNSKDGATTREEEKCNERSKCSGEPIEKTRNGFSGELFGDIQIKEQGARIPYSCPLPRDDARCNSSSGRMLREKAKDVSRGLTNHKELSRSCSLAEPSSDGGPLSVDSRGRMSNAETTEREAASTKRGRQSPLRRMLDPLLKPKNAATASRHELTLIRVCRPLDLHLEQVEKNKPSTRQALLQLAWKRGLPVFMLSSGDSDILGATVRRKCISDAADNPEFSYSIFTSQESKKKGGAAVWIRPVTKGKKQQQQLVSDVIGEVRVSTHKSNCCNNSDICHVSKEFVLVGPQLVPTATATATEIEFKSETVNTELAAIVTSLPTNNCSCGKVASAGSATAILPSGIHGASTRGGPSPLIERWRSGGECDCGGWDEGCRLSLLSLQFDSDGSKRNWGETQARFELFPQGRSKEEGHAFSMICFKEGLYTVEVKSCIPLLQAFAICIALLHSRSPVKQEMQQEKTFQARNGGPPTSYMQCHPPLSPVGRA